MVYTDREQDILKTIGSLDITPTMYKNADEKYHNIADFLSANGLNADFYPQGSFAYGTVVRPNVKNKDAAYDLDAVCQVTDSKEELSAKDLFNKVKDLFESNEVYRDKVIVYDKCITIQYADINGVGFSIDVIPAVDEDEIVKQEQKSESSRPDLVDDAIAIPKHCKQNYTWFTNNPKGFKKWFEEINSPFMENAVSYRQMLFENNQAIFKSVEEIPDGLNRSALQRVIQILKRNRDVYYDALEKANHKLVADEIKPISAIINTIVAEICKDAPATYSVFELLQYVIGEFDTYSKYQILNESDFKQRYADRNVIQKSNGKWTIKNPALGKDNLADRWNENADIPKYFFKWVQSVREDLIDSLGLNEEAEFRSHIDNAFGYETVQKSLGDKYRVCNPNVIARDKGARPWKMK